MEQSQLAVWAEDLGFLGLDFFLLIRDVVSKDPDLAQDLFNFRRRQTGQAIHRLTRSQIKRVLDHGGLPITMRAMSPKELTELLSRDEGAFSEGDESHPDIARFLDFQFQFLVLVRELARNCAATAAGVTKVRNTDTMQKLASANLQQLRNLARQNVIRFEPSIAYEMSIYLSEMNVSNERLTLAGICSTSWAAQKNQALGMGMLA